MQEQKDVLRVMGKALRISFQGVVHKHTAIARGSIVSIVKYADTLMASSLTIFFQEHRAHYSQFLSPLLTGSKSTP